LFFGANIIVFAVFRALFETSLFEIGLNVRLGLSSFLSEDISLRISSGISAVASSSSSISLSEISSGI